MEDRPDERPPTTTSSTKGNFATSCAPATKQGVFAPALRGSTRPGPARRGFGAANRSDVTAQGSCSWRESGRSPRRQPNRRGLVDLDARKSPRFGPFARCSQGPGFLLIFSPNRPPNAKNGLPNARAAQQAKPCRPAATILVRHPFENCTVFARENRSCSFAIGCGQPLCPASQSNHVPTR
jgi:hypothetical protein